MAYTRAHYLCGNACQYPLATTSSEAVVALAPQKLAIAIGNATYYLPMLSGQASGVNVCIGNTVYHPAMPAICLRYGWCTHIYNQCTDICAYICADLFAYHGSTGCCTCLANTCIRGLWCCLDGGSCACTWITIINKGAQSSGGWIGKCLHNYASCYDWWYSRIRLVSCYGSSCVYLTTACMCKPAGMISRDCICLSNYVSLGNNWC